MLLWHKLHVSLLPFLRLKMVLIIRHLKPLNHVFILFLVLIYLLIFCSFFLSGLVVALLSGSIVCTITPIIYSRTVDEFF